MERMGAFRVKVEMASRTGEWSELVEVLVDTGATYTWIPRDILRRLDLEPTEERVFILADGRHVYYGMTPINVRLEGRVMPTPVVFGDEGSEPLLGVVTLEEFGLGVDPVNEQLIPVPARRS